MDESFSEIRTDVPRSTWQMAVMKPEMLLKLATAVARFCEPFVYAVWKRKGSYE